MRARQAATRVARPRSRTCSRGSTPPCVRRGRGLAGREALRSERTGGDRAALEVGRAGSGPRRRAPGALVRPVQQDAEVAALSTVLALGWIDSREKLAGAGAVATKIDAMIAQDRGRTLTAGVNEDALRLATWHAAGRSRPQSGSDRAGSPPYLAARFRFDAPVFSRARTLNGRSFATRGKSSIPGAAKIASAGTAFARSMSCAFTLRFSSPERGPRRGPGEELAELTGLADLGDERVEVVRHRDRHPLHDLVRGRVEVRREPLPAGPPRRRARRGLGVIGVLRGGLDLRRRDRLRVELRARANASMSGRRRVHALQAELREPGCSSRKPRTRSGAASRSPRRAGRGDRAPRLAAAQAEPHHLPLAGRSRARRPRRLRRGPASASARSTVSRAA